MKYIVRLIAMALLLGMAVPEVSAQVSVRRGSSSRSEASTPKRDKKEDKKEDRKKEDRKKEDKATDVTATPQTVQRQGGPTAAPTRRPTSRKDAAAVTVDGNTVRQQAFNEYQRQEDGYIPWQHVVYRELDLTREKNASLYYPQEPQDGLTNLFRVILEGLCSGNLRGYEYLDGREVFDKKYQVNVQDILDKFQILYQQRPGVGQGAQPTYVVDEMDVPCNEVLSYFIKERWEFNQQNSKYGPRILAICPVLHRSGDFGGEAIHYPMFWINYEDLRPLLRKHLIMSDGMNNTPRFTMEEFFTLEQYEGDIYKVQNTRGLSLMQQYPNADSLKMMQAQIEKDLRAFGKSIWIDEEEQAQAADSLKASRRAERQARRSETSAPTDGKGKRNRRTKEEVDMAAVADAQEAKADEIDQRIEQTGTAHSAKRSARRGR